jgi:hypothetical protein
VNTWKANSSTTDSPIGGDANPFYSYYCHDAAHTIKARIRVVIRDWDQAFRIDSGIDNYSYTAPPAIMNSIGADTFGNTYNSYKDWDDDYSAPGTAATYKAATCGTHNAGSCSNGTDTFQYPCVLHGGAWTGDEEYKYPMSKL